MSFNRTNAFQEHMERLLNPDGVDALQFPGQNQVSLASLDDPFVLQELEHVVHKQVKPDRSCGPNGNFPGTLKELSRNFLSY